MVPGSSNPAGSLSLIVLQHVMAEFVQEDFLQHKALQRSARPFHKGRSHFRQMCNQRATLTETTCVSGFEQSCQSPWRKRLLVQENCTRCFVTPKMHDP